MNTLSKTMTALALAAGTGFTFGIAHAHGGADSLVGEDSGSVYLSRQVPKHWTRYAGPDIGRDYGVARHDPRAA
ncbi:MAG: hypothetical protein KBF65_10180 [Rubrivivax sp.]|jgi:hypothetical protein|nr:hypothetical protein [Betaproteobacteria bacterium]MBP6317929.1 hypothetical protein [Rubrivivax sp.]MBK7517611.1 hypothetical protein [Betaproteobacteria bacterium]MBK8105796.1 hypothetical protein [Betaproteobacteria bacterium]MBK8865448.1 hypothetical protein [Betaproteobacteria bacterium]